MRRRARRPDERYLAVARFEAGDVEPRSAAIRSTSPRAARRPGRHAGEDPARSWARGRFASPVLRDALLDRGVLAETLETADDVARSPALKAAVTERCTAALTADGTRRSCSATSRTSTPRARRCTSPSSRAQEPDPRPSNGGGRRMPRPRDRSPHGGTISTITPSGATTRRSSRTRSARLGSTLLRAVKAAGPARHHEPRRARPVAPRPMPTWLGLLLIAVADVMPRARDRVRLGVRRPRREPVRAGRAADRRHDRGGRRADPRGLLRPSVSGHRRRRAPDGDGAALTAMELERPAQSPPCDAGGRPT